MERSTQFALVCDFKNYNKISFHLHSLKTGKCVLKHFTRLPEYQNVSYGFILKGTKVI